MSARVVTVRTVVGLARLLGAAVCAVALVARFIWGLGSATFTASNFFAYLTIQSNLAFVVVMVLAGVVALRVPRDPRWLTTARATVLSCTVSAGAVFALLIEQAGVRGLPLDVPWSDQVLHFWLPSLALIDWAISPGRGRAPWRTIVFVVGYTIAVPVAVVLLLLWVLYLPLATTAEIPPWLIIPAGVIVLLEPLAAPLVGVTGVVVAIALTVAVVVGVTTAVRRPQQQDA